MRYFVPVFLLCVLAQAQSAPQRRATPAVNPTTASSVNPADLPAPAVKPEDKCSIEGAVVNAITGEPLKKAHLSLRPIGQRTGVPYGTITDGAGHFLIDDVDPGKYTFSASRNAYVTQTYSPQGNARQSTPLTLANGQKLKEIAFKLMPQGVISGRILDEDGEPMANVVVQCMVFGYQRGKKQLMGRNGNSTDDRGEFRMHGLSPGKYILSATYQSPEVYMASQERTVGAPQAVQAAEEGYATTFYPNTTNASSASQLDVTPGAQITGLTMTLVRTRTVRVKGHINTGLASQSRRNANVLLLPRDDIGFMMPRAVARGIDAQGNFQMRGVAPGSYVLRADFMEGNKRYSARMPLEVGSSNVEGIEVNLQPPADLSGRVIVEDNGALGEARLNVTLQPKGNGPMMGGAGAQVKDDMTFQLNNVGPDPYDVNVSNLPEGFYLKSVRMGQQDVTETGVDFTQGVSADEMTVIVNPNGGQIDGNVQDAKGESAAGATVTLIPDEAHRSLNWLYKTANTDQNGHFTIKGLRPGKYKVYAWEDIEPGAYQDPDFVRPHESAGETVDAKEGAHDSVQLKAVPAEKSASDKALR